MPEHSVGRPDRNSLRARLARWMLPPLAALIAINAALSYLGALDAVDRAYDRSLGASIRSIAERVHSLEGDISVDIPSSTFATFDADTPERVYHAIFAPDGHLVTGYAELAPPAGLRDDGSLRFAGADFRGIPIRVGAMRKRLYDPALAGGDLVTIVFAESTDSRRSLATDLFVESLKRQVLIIGLGAVVLLFALRSAFRPLLALHDTIEQRDEEDLTPIVAKDVPSEVHPLIRAINHHMERISTMLASRRRFLTDAAHQIRTPLAVLTTQAEVGVRQTDPAAMRDTFRHVLRSLGNTQRMANQLLALSRAEPANGLIGDKVPCDLTDLAREVAADLVPLALARDIEIAFEGEAATPLAGNEAMLREMVANLVDNAIRYSSAGTQVVVSAASHPDAVELRVTDQGPGIAPEEREFVFRRFYRILGQGNAEGSGLGLAIVREIAHAHRGRITLESGPDGRGLQVRIRFPLNEG
ncbi:sensor histidine kinase [Nitrogeniibacter aestuarii]|uniref:sensor histidine kinase n=1 Tax=Nitrogeniibacter aestuarii TaxID=2815343 RepID=UPI001E4227C6|nr:sensor histidine kinase [Nitrogeniibacter aestuarii]